MLFKVQSGCTTYWSVKGQPFANTLSLCHSLKHVGGFLHIGSFIEIVIARLWTNYYHYCVQMNSRRYVLKHIFLIAVNYSLGDLTLTSFIFIVELKYVNGFRRSVASRNSIINHCIPSAFHVRQYNPIRKAFALQCDPTCSYNKDDLNFETYNVTLFMVFK